MEKDIDKETKLITKKDQDPSKYISKEAQLVITQEMRELERRLEEKFSKDKSSLLTIFGIFASLVTFLLIEVQILKNICDFWRLFGFSFFILGGLLTFVFILQYLTKSWIENDNSIEIGSLFRHPKTWRINISVVLALIVIILLFLFGYKIIKEKANSEFYCKEKEIFETYQKSTEEQLELMDQKISNLSTQVDNLKKK